jgi:hypothetical protein
MDLEFDDEDYKNFPKFVVFLLVTYRNSIGDFNTPKYNKWL